MCTVHEEGNLLISDQPCFTTNKRHMIHRVKFENVIVETVFPNDVQDGFIE